PGLSWLLPMLEEKRRQRRHHHRDRPGPTVAAMTLGLHTAAITHSAATIVQRVGVDQLTIVAWSGHPDAIAGVHRRGHVDHCHYYRGGATAYEAEQRLVLAIGIDPLETLCVVVHLIHGRHLAVDAIKVPDQLLQPLMR